MASYARQVRMYEHVQIKSFEGKRSQVRVANANCKRRYRALRAVRLSPWKLSELHTSVKVLQTHAIFATLPYKWKLRSLLAKNCSLNADLSSTKVSRELTSTLIQQMAPGRQTGGHISSINFMSAGGKIHANGGSGGLRLLHRKAWRGSGYVH